MATKTLANAARTSYQLDNRSILREKKRSGHNLLPPHDDKTTIDSRHAYEQFQIALREPISFDGGRSSWWRASPSRKNAVTQIRSMATDVPA